MEREAWLSGRLDGVSQMLMPSAHALMQARSDIELTASGLSVAEVWEKPCGAPSVGFHLRHIAGSIDRLLSYARGATLTPEQFARLASESEPGDSPEPTPTLIAAATEKINEALTVIRATPDQLLFIERRVGREKLQTTVFGLLFHIAEHTMRHTGQIVTTARFVRSGADSRKPSARV